MYTVELDIEECMKQNPKIKLILSKLGVKPARLEFSKMPWAPLDVVSVLAREGETRVASSSTELAAEGDAQFQGPDLEQRGTSNASTTGRRSGEFLSCINFHKSVRCIFFMLVAEHCNYETYYIMYDWLIGHEMAKVVVVGSGPAGLFAALVLAESGAKVTLVERGQPVEGRGKDIGALMVRRLLNAESNLCYGEVCARSIVRFHEILL